MSQIVPGCRRPLVPALGFAVFLSVLLTGCSGQTTARTGDPAAGASSPEAPAAPAANPPAAGETLPAAAPLPEPPDGNWLVDDQGRQYFVDKVPKEDGGYMWLDPEKTRVQVRYGAVYDVVGQDGGEFFMVKIYRPGTEERPGPVEVTPEQLKEVAESYRNTTGKADRLQLEPFGRGLPERGQWRNGFEIADMNGDGHPDIVHGPARKGNRRPQVFLGDGKGNWRLWSELRFPPLPYDYGDVAVADFNGDGRLDIGLAVHLHGLIALVADGPTSFKEWGKGLDFHTSASPPTDQPIFSSRAVEAADMNKDGRPDLIALGEGPRLAQATTPGEQAMRGVPGGYGMAVYFNQGDGTWLRRSEAAKDNVRLHGDKVVVGDFTRDGNLDTVLGSNVLGSKGILRIGSADGSWNPAMLDGLRSGFVGAADLADFNGDGRLDLAVGYLSHELEVWRTGIDLFLGRADGGWDRRAVAVEDGRSWLTALDSGDLDGDGKLDLVALTGEGQTWVLLGKGDGSFDREETPEIPLPAVGGGCRGYDVKIADLDGEPGGEIVMTFAGEPSALFAPNLCVDEGRILAWKARRKP
ncbi:MAG TPA: VCBS repeat-containing protein [Thermoanaerobaculia bacterium]|nr:VCBS repeat-containing protein [Thermoanaerobaculia bacterium]